MDQAVEHSVEPGGDVDLSQRLCDEIKTFARQLPEMTYYEVLGIERDAEHDEVRRAFFERSKTFHPDRYFTKQLGTYEPLLHEIYKRVVAAHEVLRDAKMRKDYEATLRAEPSFRIGKPSKYLGLPGAEELAAPVPEEAPESEAPTSGAGRSLRSRRGLRSRHTVLADLQARLEVSRRKARGHFLDAKREIEKEDFVRAASLVRMALAFDPREREYHEALADVVPRANAEAAQSARDRGEMLLSREKHEEALGFLEEAFRLVPTDGALAHTISGLLLAKDDSERALDFARLAVELDEKSAEYRKSLGMLLIDRGEPVEARKELQRAWELDPMDKDVRKALSVL
jgi:curved DNA-binding protein CbpA